MHFALDIMALILRRNLSSWWISAQIEGDLVEFLLSSSDAGFK